MKVRLSAIYPSDIYLKDKDMEKKTKKTPNIHVSKLFLHRYITIAHSLKIVKTIQVP